MLQATLLKSIGWSSNKEIPPTPSGSDVSSLVISAATVSYHIYNIHTQLWFYTKCTSYSYKGLLLFQFFMCLPNEYFSELINQIKVEYGHLIPWPQASQHTVLMMITNYYCWLTIQISQTHTLNCSARILEVMLLNTVWKCSSIVTILPSNLNQIQPIIISYGGICIIKY